ncbi:DUF2783 domain-containing protein [Caldimonas sp. KR1-144]|uniref:DUF2783 domain-containing protein n=1 Tax=Caldimonas sp. KR1-144 TaxID=3400911 RepID=UPI003C0D2F47
MNANATLVTAPNLAAPDDFYAALLDAHREFTTAQSHALNAKLVLLLANHIGDQAVLQQALDAARANTLRGLPTRE